MNNQLREIILQIVLEEYESGHQVASDKESFDRIIAEDYGREVGPEAFEFYAECRNMGPGGFYLMYKDELDFSPEFKTEYGFNEEEEIEESLNEDIDPSLDDKYEVQEVDDKGERLDQFVSFNTEEEAMNFIKKLNTPAQVVQKGVMEESLSPNGKVIYTNINSLEEGLSRDAMISELRNKGKNYNFDKYSDAQIYRMYEREMSKKEAPKFTLPEKDDFIDPQFCEICKHRLTDNGECPVCDLGDEEERTSHTLYDIEEEESEVLNEDTLNEGPFRALKNRIGKRLNKLKKKYTNARLNYDNKKANKELDKKSNPVNVAAVLERTFRDPENEYLIDGEWVKLKDIKPQLERVIRELNNMEQSLQRVPLDPDSDMVKFINTVVIDTDANIIRRGLELIPAGNLKFEERWPSRLEIKDGFRAEDIIGTSVTTSTGDEAPSEESTDETSTEAEATSVRDKAESNEETTSETTNETPSWITNTSIKAAIRLLAKRKNGSAEYYDKDGNLVDYRKITTENVNDIFTDKEATKPFIDMLEEVKAGLAKRKAAAIKSAALFGESYDDSLDYDESEDIDLDEGVNIDEFNELNRLAAEIGIKTGAEMNAFIHNERQDNESTLDTLRRYRDDLGDDFELKESFDMSPEINVVDLNDDFDNSLGNWY